MNTTTRCGLALCGLVVVAACNSAMAQPVSNVCRSEEPNASRVIAKVQEAVTASEEPFTTFRDSVGYPAGDSADVSLVTDEAVCQQAELAYRNAISGTGTLSGRVFVVKAGATYTVWDPEYLFNPTRGGNYVYMVFSDTFQLKSVY